MSFHGDDTFPFLQIVQKSGLHFLAEIDHCLISSFSAYLDAAYVKVDVIDVQAYAFRDPDACPKEQGQ